MTKKTTCRKKDNKIPVQTPDVAYGMKQVYKTYKRIKKEGMPKTITIEVDKFQEGLALMATHPRIPLDKVKRHNMYAGEILEGMFSYAPFIMEAVEEKIVSMGDNGLTMDDAFEGVANLLQDLSEGVRTLRNHFEDYICDGVDRSMVMNWFKETISHKDGRGMSVMIIAAIQHGYNENAVRIQIHVAIITYCLIAIIEHDLEVKMDTYYLLRILSVSLLDKAPIRELYCKRIRQITSKMIALNSLLIVSPKLLGQQ